jgi:hypothetical protein
MKEFLYCEEIIIDSDKGEFKLDRQKDAPDGKWYGIGLYKYTEGAWLSLADGDEWIAGTFYKQLMAGTYKEKWDLEIPCKKKTAKALETLIKEAYRLGWFDYLIEKQ